MNAKFYVGTYKKYNNGNLFGEWLTLSDYADAEEFLNACKELHADESDPEFMFQNYEDMPKRFYGESLSKEEIQEIYDFQEEYDRLAETYDENALDAWLELGNDNFDNFEECYCGEWNSDEDFTEDLIMETTDMNAIPDWIQNHIDWKWLARDIMYDYQSENGHYFRNY